MNINANSLANLKPIQPGVSGNPGGKPVGARNRLQGSFVNALADDFAAHGKQAIIDCRERKPDKYLAVIASLMPKEIEIVRPLDDVTDDQIDAAVTAVGAILAAQNSSAGAGRTESEEPASSISSVQETG